MLGYYLDSNYNQIDFVYDTKSNTFTTVNDPAGVNGSTIAGINNSGEIAGTSAEANGEQAFTASLTQPDTLSVTVSVADNSGALLYDAGQIGSSVTLTPAQLTGLQLSVPHPRSAGRRSCSTSPPPRPTRQRQHRKHDAGHGCPAAAGRGSAVERDDASGDR